jgi:hypothetical protein
LIIIWTARSGGFNLGQFLFKLLEFAAVKRLTKRLPVVRRKFGLS